MPTFFVFNKIRSDGKGDVRDGGKQSYEDTGRNEPQKTGCRGHEQKRDRDGTVHAHHERAAFQHVAKGHEQKHSACVTDLDGHGDQSDVSLGGVEGSGHFAE